VLQSCYLLLLINKNVPQFCLLGRVQLQVQGVFILDAFSDDI
jgi:hypothetical protein